jgi:hypothetical protein
MSIAKLWKDKEDSDLSSVFEELCTIASAPTFRSEDLAELYVFCKDYDEWDALPARIALLKNIARHPNVPPDPEILQDLRDKYPQAFLENPALPFLFLENSNLFADAELSLLQCEYIPEYVFEALKIHEDIEIRNAIGSHWLIVGEVVGDEDYTQGLQRLQRLPIRRKYHEKILEEGIYPEFIVSKELKKLVWSPKETLIESRRCHNALKKRYPIMQGKPNRESNSYVKLGKTSDTLMELIDNIKHSRKNFNNWKTENLRIISLSYLYHQLPSAFTTTPRPESRLCVALNPRNTIEDLKTLSHDGNRYVRATARAALEMREGS